MPYTPTMNVRGIKIVAIIVRTFMTSFILMLTLERYMSSIPDVMSLDVSIVPASLKYAYNFPQRPYRFT